MIVCASCGLRGERVSAELSPTDQWLLHDFFKLSYVLSDLELLAYREAVQAVRPRLPHQAGRALSRFGEPPLHWLCGASMARRQADVYRVGCTRRVRQQYERC